MPAILGPAARALVEDADLRPGESVVDVGCGTGAAARFAGASVGPSGRATGVDVNRGMIDVARGIPAAGGAALEWFEHSAYELPFQDREFDVVLCAQTLQFLEDRQLALAEMHRVLKPGGRLAASLWCELPASPYFDALVRAVTKHIGPETAAGLQAAFGLSDPKAIRGLLTAAGFGNPRVSVRRLELDVPPPGDFVPRHIGATPMSAGFRAASEEARRAIVDDVTQALSPYRTDRGLSVPFSTHLVAGIRP